MAGIFLLLIFAFWFFIVASLVPVIVRPMRSGFLKVFGGVIVFSTLLVSPLLDDIAGGFQFRAICEKGGGIIYDADKVRGKTVLWTARSNKKMDHTIVPIEESSIAWVDVSSGEKLIEYREYHALGGWLSRAVAFNGVTRPYTFDGACGVKNEFYELENQLNIERVYK